MSFAKVGINKFNLRKIRKFYSSDIRRVKTYGSNEASEQVKKILEDANQNIILMARG